MGGHQVASCGATAAACKARSTRSNATSSVRPTGYHETTAILDKIAAGQLVARREDMATNQLLSHVLEQLLARGKRQRDTEAATMNMRLAASRRSRRRRSVIQGAADDLRTWRQP